MSCRDEILDCAQRIIRQTGRDEFSVPEVIECMQLRGTAYDEKTIRTTITAKMCGNCPKTNGDTFDDLERVRHDVFRLTSS